MIKNYNIINYFYRPLGGCEEISHWRLPFKYRPRIVGQKTNLLQMRLHHNSIKH